MVALQAHRDRQLFHRASGVAWTDLDLVFPNGEGKLMEAQNHHRRSWRPLLERSGLLAETTFHSLRHTYATHCVQQGIDINTVQTWLGHSTSKMLLEVYAHYGPAHGVSQTDLLIGLLGAVAS
jgi:integrase